jgi:hypothetical protein
MDHIDCLDESFTPRAGQTLADYLRRVRSQFAEHSAPAKT